MNVLVVVDMQNDFINGALGTAEARTIVPNVKAKIAQAVENGDLIVYTRDTHFDNYLNTREGVKLPVEHCKYGSEGWRIPDELLPPGDYDNVVHHNKYSFGDVSLTTAIQKRLITSRACDPNFVCDEIELVGLCTDICVVSNALILKSAFAFDYDISVDANCCAGVTPETHEAALKTMEMCQINIKR